MAYDPEARSQSNSAMIIGVVALVLLVGGALAYLSTRNAEPDVVAVSNPPARETVIVEQPAPAPASPVVIEKSSPAVVVTPPVTRTIEKNTTVTRDRVITPPVRQSETKTEVNVTNVVPERASEPNKTTLQPQAGSDASEPAPTAAQ